MKDGLTTHSDGNLYTSNFSSGESVIDQIQKGGSISDDDYSNAGVEIAYGLRSGDEGSQIQAKQMAASIYGAIQDGASKAEMLGWLLVAGAPSIELVRLISEGKEGALVRGILGGLELGDFLDLPSGEKLERLVELIDDGEPNREPKPRPPVEELNSIIQRQIEICEDEDDASGDGGDGNDKKNRLIALGDMLVDEDVDPDARHAAAVELRQMGIPILLELARSDNPVAREHAFTGLVKMGRDPNGFQDAMRDAITLESEKSTRNLGESVRACVQGGELDAAQNSDHWSQGPVATSWLDAAFESADSPSILAAATGREVFAIPMAVRRIWNVQNP